VPYYAVISYEGEVVRGIGSTLPAEERAHEFVAFLKGEPVASPTPGMVEPKLGPGSKPADWPAGLPGPMPQDLKEIFDFEAKFTAGKVKPGAEVTLELRFNMKASEAGPYNLYHPKSPHTVELDDSLLFLTLVGNGGLEPVGEWNFPEPYVLAADDPQNVFGTAEWKFYGNLVFTHRFKVPDNANGSVAVSGTLAGQYCDPRVCTWFLDMNRTPFGWVAEVEVAPDGVASALAEPSMDKAGVAKPAGGEVASQGTGTLAEEIEKSGGLFWFLLGVFGLGMITLLTPCVLPVLPLTIGFFVKQAEQNRSPLVAALIYSACIIATFTVFGLVTSLLLGDQGAQIISTNPYVNVGIALLFTVFALSFFGMFELRMPSFLSSWISRKQMKTQQAGRGYATALLSGGSFAVISFSCTGPIAATILAGAAGGTGAEGDMSRWIPTLAMLVYSSGLALPIFIMGQFPSLLKKLPKSGGWMNAMKVTFAFIEIAVAIRYFAWAEIGFTGEPVPSWISREVVDGFWIACSIGAGIYLLGLFRMPHDHEPTGQIGVIRMLIAIGFLSFGLYMLPGLVNDKPMGLLDGFLPPRAIEEEFTWHQDLDDALAEAKRTGKPVFIDFTGVICANCRWVEKNIFPKGPVHSRLGADFVLCQQWTDRKNDQEPKDNYEKYGQGGKGVPMYVIVDPDGTMVEKLVPPQFINSLTPEEFAAFLDRGKAKATKR
jgi:thiol:disulfide interchange protein DsbD